MSKCLEKKQTKKQIGQKGCEMWQQPKNFCRKSRFCMFWGHFVFCVSFHVGVLCFIISQIHHNQSWLPDFHTVRNISPTCCISVVPFWISFWWDPCSYGVLAGHEKSKLSDAFTLLILNITCDITGLMRKTFWCKHIQNPQRIRTNFNEGQISRGSLFFFPHFLVSLC